MFFRKKISHEAMTDEDLIGLFRKSQDSELIGVLFSRYSHLVLGVCMKYLKNKEEAKDAVMHLFEKLPPELLRHEINNFRSWLYMVAKNHCLMQLRRDKAFTMQEISVNSENIFVESEEELHLVAETEEQLAALEQNILYLTGEQRQCIELFYLQDKSYKEICEITGFTLLSVKSFIQNGKRNLKNLMLEKNGSGKRT